MAPTPSTPGDDICQHRTLSGSSGGLSSPNYPDDYDNHLDCETTITVPDGLIVSISIVDIEIESTSGSSCWDQLRVSKYTSEPIHYLRCGSTNIWQSTVLSG